MSDQQRNSALADLAIAKWVAAGSGLVAGGLTVFGDCIGAFTPEAIKQIGPMTVLPIVVVCVWVIYTSIVIGAARNINIKYPRPTRSAPSGGLWQKWHCPHCGKEIYRECK